MDNAQKSIGIEVLMVSLGEQYERLFEIEHKLRDAQSQRTEAVNRINELQERIDEVLAKLRTTAPAGTDWWSVSQPRRAV